MLEEDLFLLQSLLNYDIQANFVMHEELAK